MALSDSFERKGKAKRRRHRLQRNQFPSRASEPSDPRLLPRRRVEWKPKCQEQDGHGLPKAPSLQRWQRWPRVFACRCAIPLRSPLHLTRRF